MTLKEEYLKEASDHNQKRDRSKSPVFETFMSYQAWLEKKLTEARTVLDKGFWLYESERDAEILDYPIPMHLIGRDGLQSHYVFKDGKWVFDE